MGERKVFMNGQGKATFVCPKCQKSKVEDVGRYKNINKAIRVKCKCPCGFTYHVLLERRKYYRKKTNLSGMYVFGPYNLRGPITVKDLSRIGLKFEVKDNKGMDIGDKVRVEFKLDDKQNTLIQKDVVIRTISGNTMGAEFSVVTDVELSDRMIAFYLFN